MNPDDEGDVVALDAKGRLSVPRQLREELGLVPGERLRITVEEGSLRVAPAAPKPRKLTARRKWGKEAFLGAGEALVGDEE